jgi:hypothetical protein
MMKYPFLVSLLLVFAACKSVNEEAAEYNNRVIELQRKITDDLSLMDSTLRDPKASKDRIEYHYARLQACVKESILALDSVGSFNNDPLLLVGARSLFQTYEELIDEDYKALVALKNIPPEAITLAIQDSSITIQSGIRKDSQNAQDEFALLQKEFAVKFHLELK